MNILKGLLLIGLVTSFGCSERYLAGKGAETLVYPETHVYEFSAKSKLEAKQKLEDIFKTVDSIDSGPSYLIEYKNKSSQKLATESFKDLPLLKYRADQFEWKRNGELTSDLRITITFHNFVVKECQPVSIERDIDSRNCFSENARNKQVAYKERLVEGI